LFLIILKYIRVEKRTRIYNMIFVFNFFEWNNFKYEKNKKNPAQVLIFYFLIHACGYMPIHVYANIYIVLILLRTSGIIFSI
jgi:hypothetical protein